MDKNKSFVDQGSVNNNSNGGGLVNPAPNNNSISQKNNYLKSEFGHLKTEAD